MRALYIIYFITTALPTIVVLTILASLLTIIGTACGSSRVMSYWPAHIWARCFAWLSLVSVRVKGRENISRDKSYVFVANHQGSYDIFAIYGWLGHNFKWMMKKSLERIPFVGRACKSAGHIFVDRSSAAGVRHTMQQAEERLRDGMSLVIFPEGARTFTGRMGKFKKGAFALALEFGLPIVPVTIDGAYRVMPRTARLPRPGRITLTIHKPIDSPTSDSDKDRVIASSYEAIESALPYKTTQTANS